MSFADDAEFAAFIGRDHMLAGVTPQAVGSALQGFALPLSADRDLDWLAMAVRRALAITVKANGEGPARKSNYEIRQELSELSEAAAATWQRLFECSWPADYRIWTVAWRHWEGEGGKQFGDGKIMGEPPDYRRFKDAIAELEWIARFLRLVALDTEPQRGPWRQSEEKRLRVQRGQYLAPVYEAAFGQRVSANNFPTDARIKAQTPFMDFYGRMVTLAFGARETANLTEVVKIACRLHRQQPAEFANGVIPGL
jgi:hypothetical protein